MYILLAFTASKLKDVKCGSDGCETKGVENRACEPILVPSGDIDFYSKPCIMFVRSQEVPRDDCAPGEYRVTTAHQVSSLCW